MSDLSEEEEEDKLEIGEHTLSEVMMWLEQEVESSSSSYSSPASNYRQETQFVTINGNEESCGPSFSGSASTVMASVDTRGVPVVPYLVGGPTDRSSAWHAPDPLSWPWAGCAAAGEEEDEDAWVARVLCGVGLELDGILM
ncbi:uncharacterized protein [Typha latifolia]|uniref:uncharacterized protein n=1 Tax=Typha latifolia TaxID=4733 RepID=UPI003C3064ED